MAQYAALFLVSTFLSSSFGGLLNEKEIKAASAHKEIESPLSSDEEITFIPAQNIPQGGVGLHESFLGILQKSHKNPQLRIFDLYLLSPTEIAISKKDCETSAQKLLYISPKRRLQIDKISPLVVNGARACDVKLVDPDPHFHERHLFIFTARKKTFVVAALFPQGSNPLEMSSLRQFIKSLH